MLIISGYNSCNINAYSSNKLLSLVVSSGFRFFRWLLINFVSVSTCKYTLYIYSARPVASFLGPEKCVYK